MLNVISNPIWLNVMERQRESTLTEVRKNQAICGRILVVDDDSPTLALTREILEDCGYEVTTRQDGLEALNLFCSAASQFDMVITDHHMPLMTGLSLANKIRGIRSDVPIILCSGDQQVLAQARKQMLGRHKVMHKPISARELTRTIRGMLVPPGPNP
jgi:CheY-like chemotaxis protein